MSKYIAIGTGPHNVFWTTFNPDRNYEEEGYTILHQGDDESEMVSKTSKYVHNAVFWDKLKLEKERMQAAKNQEDSTLDFLHGDSDFDADAEIGAKG